MEYKPKIKGLALRVVAWILPGLLLSGSGCTSPSAMPESLLGEVPTMPFQHTLIDATLPGYQNDCCSDALALGDLDGDGYLDVVLGTQYAETDGLVWYAYPTWTRHAIGSGNFTTDAQVADLDSDGDLDLVTSQFDPNLLEWWENKGHPQQSNGWTRHHIAPHYAHDLAVADLNGDGNLDVIKSPKGGPGGWYQAPDDPRQAWTFHPIPETTGEGLATGDLDQDGDLDVVMGRHWYENREGQGLTWSKHEIASSWGDDCRVVLADMNADAAPDIVLSHSEGEGRLSWFENPEDRASPWTEHPIEPGTLSGAHSLAAADFDGDGDLDVFVGQMHTTPQKRVLIYQQNPGETWHPIHLAETGTHNAQIGDIDQDGDFDIVGKNYGGKGRKVELWQNLGSDMRSIAAWQFIEIDHSRPEDQRGKMGLVFADINHDDRIDIIAGSYGYANPGGDLLGPWTRTALPEGQDVYFAMDIDDDPFADLIGARGTTLEWIEAADTLGHSWTTYPIATLPEGRTQGYTIASLVPGGKEELVFSRGKNLFCLEIPHTQPEKGTWNLVQVSSMNEEEGVAAGDLDQDGDLDLVVPHADGHRVLWFENPGNGQGEWAHHPVGSSEQWLDRLALADINRDGRLDIVATEETPDWFFNAHLYWYEAPLLPKAESWPRHRVATLRSINSMDVADLDGDGDIDIVAAEHTDHTGKAGATDNLTVIYENQGDGTYWKIRIVELGPHSSHLGTRLQDLDGDGDLDLVSLAWSQYQHLYLWKNDSQTPRSPG